MANDTSRYHVFSISDNSGFGIPPQKDKDGCFPCRFRKKRCTPDPRALDGVCVDCRKFNMCCIGRGIDRPSEPSLAEEVRAVAKLWIADRTNRMSSVAPLDLSYLWSHLLSSAPAHVTTSSNDSSPDPDPDLDGASAVTTPSLFSTPEASPPHIGLVPPQFPGTYRAHTDSSHHHAAAVPRSSQQRIDVSMIDPRDITFSLHDQFLDHRQYLPSSGDIWSEDFDDYRSIHGPMDYIPNVSFLPSPYSSDDVPSHSTFPGSYNAFRDPAESDSRGQARFVTPEQLLLADLNEMGVPWDHPQAHR